MTGIEPRGAFLSFTNHDVIKNIDIHRDQTIRNDDLNAKKSKIAIGTSKKCRQYITSEMERNKPRTLEAPGILSKKLGTDHISYVPSVPDKPFQKVYDQMITKAPYAANFKSVRDWEPQKGADTVNNRNSVPENILTWKENPLTGKKVVGTLDAKICNRKKGMAEFVDLNRVTALKVNQGHRIAYNENPMVFHRKTGIFSHMYDAAAKNGNLSVPFRK